MYIILELPHLLGGGGSEGHAGGDSADDGEDGESRQEVPLHRGQQATPFLRPRHLPIFRSAWLLHPDYLRPIIELQQKIKN